MNDVAVVIKKCFKTSIQKPKQWRIGVLHGSHFQFVGPPLTNLLAEQLNTMSLLQKLHLYRHLNGTKCALLTRRQGTIQWYRKFTKLFFFLPLFYKALKQKKNKKNMASVYRDDLERHPPWHAGLNQHVCVIIWTLANISTASVESYSTSNKTSFARLLLCAQSLNWIPRHKKRKIILLLGRRLLI